MQVTTESYSALGELLPEEKLTVASTFHCDLGPAQGMPDGAVLGLWVQIKEGIVEPRYLSQAQLNLLTGG
jgi:hypothetical protein